MFDISENCLPNHKILYSQPFRHYIVMKNLTTSPVAQYIVWACNHLVRILEFEICQVTLCLWSILLLQVKRIWCINLVLNVVIKHKHHNKLKCAECCVFEYLTWYGIVNVASTWRMACTRGTLTPCLLRESTRQLLMYSLDKTVSSSMTPAGFHVQKYLHRSADFCFKLSHRLPKHYLRDYSSLPHNVSYSTYHLIFHSQKGSFEALNFPVFTS